MSCILNSGFDNKPSVTHSKLLSHFGTDENGIAKANAEYVRLTSDEFLSKFHGNEPTWIELQQLGDLSKVDRSRFTEQFEPAIHEASSGELFYKNHDGSRTWVDGKPFSFLSTKARKKLVLNTVFSAVQGWESDFLNIDFENEINIPVIETMENLNEFLDIIGATQSDKDWLKSEVLRELKNRQIVLQDTDDVQDQLDEEGNELQYNEEDGESRVSNEVVKVESFLKNSKDNATANIKLMLSFVPDFETYSETEQTYKRGELDEEIGLNEENTLPSFKDPHQIWRKLEDNLGNLFTQEQDGKVVSVLSQMLTKLESLAKTDPAIGYILDSVNSMPEWKQIQFASAFTKAKIIFNTTEVTGDIGSYNYKVLDPYRTGSQVTKIKNNWAESIAQSSLFNRTVDPNTGIVTHTLNGKELNNLRKLIQQAGVMVTKAKNKSWGELGDLLTQTENILKTFGIPVDSFNNENYLSLFQEIQESQNINTPRDIISYILRESTVAVAAIRGQDNFTKGGKFKNPIHGTGLLDMFARNAAITSEELGESTVMLAGNKMAWTYSLPTYLDLRLAEIKAGIYINADGIMRNKFVEKLEASSPYYRNDKFLQRLHDKRFVDKLNVTTFASLQKEFFARHGKDNKDITFSDQLADKVFKTLMPRVEPNNRPIWYTPAPADKGRALMLQGFTMSEITVEIKEDGSVLVSPKGGSVLEYITDALESEYLRAKEAFQQAKQGNLDEMSMYYHLKQFIKEDGSSEYKAVNEKGNPVGNAVQIQLFPSLTPYSLNKDGDMEINSDPLSRLLYSGRDATFKFNLDSFEGIRDQVKKYVAEQLDKRIQNTLDTFLEKKLLVEEDGVIRNNTIDSRLWNYYSDRFALIGNEQLRNKAAATALAADFEGNGMASHIAYNKIFSGDIAYYKNLVDYNKRVPATYTDGKLLMLGNNDPLKYNVAVIDNVIVPAQDLKTMKKDFVQSITESVKYMDDATKKIYTEDYIEALADQYTNQYKKVNTTDAQAYITLDRWKFLKQKLGEWNPNMDQVYERLQSGKFTHDDIKFAAQPLKGVYFNQNTETGVPTYLKYSQAVLIPSVVKGTQLEYVLDAMNKEKVDELVTLDGVKAGALQPTVIHDQQGNYLKDISLNPFQLDNSKWKLQQQLPVKGAKENFDLGSQLMKNIISNIYPDADYGGKTGAEVLQQINDTVSGLADIAFNETINSLGLDPNGKIVDKDKFYNKLIQTAVDKNLPTYVVSALERQYDIDAIPQLRYKLQNIISSQFNKGIAKTITPGGSFIQVSNTGITKQDVDSKSGIYMLKDVEKLERPKIITDENGKAKIQSGQVFLPHSFIAKYIPDYATLSREEFNKKVDPELLKLIGYRIPNQKLSSNQPLEVVGILPETMGDSIMMYSEITTQTGSDFDIDKTYVMMPAFNVIYSNNKDVENALFNLDDTERLNLITNREDYNNYITENPLPEDKRYNNNYRRKRMVDYIVDRNLVPQEIAQKYVKKLSYVKPGNENKKQLQNQLFESYYNILTSPLSYADMQSGIDGSLLQNTIEELHGRQDQLEDLQLMSPTYQMQIKFDNISGKAGVGLTANQMVDHTFSQMLNQKMPVETELMKGYLNYDENGNIDFGGIFDKDGKKITDSISMFLNAFVDIAKDPYITRGNFNTHTSNSAFFLLRAGMPLPHVVAFMGQPVLKKGVSSYDSQQSTLAKADIRGLINNIYAELENINGQFESITDKVADIAVLNNIVKVPITAELTKKNLTDNIKTLQQDFNDLLKMSPESIKREHEKDPIGIETKVENALQFVATQERVAEEFAKIHGLAEKLAEQVLVSKADVNGGGPDIVTHFTGINRLNKVLSEANFTMLDSKLTGDNMLANKTKYTLGYLNKLDEELFVTMHPYVKPLYNLLHARTKRDAYATDKKIVKLIEKSLYGSLSHMALEGSPYQVTNSDISRLQDVENGIVARVQRAKTDDVYSDLKIIQALESVTVDVRAERQDEAGRIITVKTGEQITLLSVDNFKNKPNNSLQELYDSWEDMLNSDNDEVRKTALDLVKYAIYTSAFSKNKNSIYEFMPLDVSDYMHRGMERLKINNQLPTVFKNAIKDFFRNSENSDYLASVSIPTLWKGANLDMTKAKSKGKEMKEAFNLPPQARLIQATLDEETLASLDDKTRASRKKMIRDIRENGIVKIGAMLYEYHGEFTSDDNTEPNIILIAPTHRLGKDYGTGAVYEFGGDNESAFKTNNPVGYKQIRESIDKLKENGVLTEVSSTITDSLMADNRPEAMKAKSGNTLYDADEAVKRLVSKGIMKENKC